MKAATKAFNLLLLYLLPGAVYAQTAEMADRLRADGKIYVLLAIILIVLAGFIVYLFLMDRKVKKLEDRVEKRSKNV
ncbi:MAG TPA: CcmD family protein [Ohtaekwangia sp.]|nr:CcmD family protein [Ohtaekwangia sp.]